MYKYTCVCIICMEILCYVNTNSRRDDSVPWFHVRSSCARGNELISQKRLIRIYQNHRRYKYKTNDLGCFTLITFKSRDITATAATPRYWEFIYEYKTKNNNSTARTRDDVLYSNGSYNNRNSFECFYKKKNTQTTAHDAEQTQYIRVYKFQNHNLWVVFGSGGKYCNALLKQPCNTYTHGEK